MRLGAIPLLQQKKKNHDLTGGGNRAQNFFIQWSFPLRGPSRVNEGFETRLKKSQSQWSISRFPPRITGWGGVSLGAECKVHGGRKEL